jgi:hypothetical protein
MNTSAKYGLLHGVIREDFLDSLDIYSTPNSTVCEDLTECRMQPFLLTHADSVARHNDVVARRR